MPVVTDRLVYVKVRCLAPAQHVLPVSVPPGTMVMAYCRSCGREYEIKVGSTQAKANGVRFA